MTRDICVEDALPGATGLMALGTPDSTEDFHLAGSVTEFRVKLLNHFRLPRNAGVEIREQGWSKRECRLTIWSVRRGREWQPIEQLFWSAGDSF